MGIRLPPACLAQHGSPAPAAMDPSLRLAIPFDPLRTRVLERLANNALKKANRNGRAN